MKELPRFIPVIHVTSDEQTLRQADTAFSNGAGGIFLIDHKRNYKKLLVTYEAVRTQYPDNWIGINFLDLTSEEAIFYHPNTSDGLWLDDGGFYKDEKGIVKAEEYRGIAELTGLSPRCGNHHHYRMFSGFEFKYQKPADDLEEAARWARIATDVPTTSGDGTGLAADVVKIKNIKELLREKPLAIASGITLENIKDYIPYIDCFMVATGISTSFERFDADKLREMAQILK